MIRKGLNGGSYKPLTTEAISRIHETVLRVIEEQEFETDIEDGYDTIEWIAAQDFSNGKIGIFGVR